jgi:hypothetical protein
MALVSQKKLLLQTYKLLEDVTPLSVDCGTLCDHACCKGDEHTGMWLFPGEEELLRDCPDFEILECKDNAGYPMVVCKGHCDRKLRPLSCRIFPLFPLVKETEQGGITIEVIVDPRAGIVCPLKEKALMTTMFQLRVRRAASKLLTDPEMRTYLLETGAFLEELRDFQKLFAR